ncbi:MAG TPA: hydrogenase nickel incorporation protein HypB [Candidatus Binatia bacterium]|jgi:hydrogenase nickel incorporation protein HypB|nr:hydrogenase nickel incorporation protein HypB [Candidatus Binatia bacterium]
MCDACGCGDTNLVPVEVHARLLERNDEVAAHNREHFRRRDVVAINVMGSPGAGKTALLEATARRLRGSRQLAALAGDLATERDAVRLRTAGIASSAITTGQACHLDAAMVHHALHEQSWPRADYLFIENVGNLVCPAIYDLGQEMNVVALSVTEGEDKPLKYPVMFRHADLVVLTKTDLLAVLDFDSAALADALARVMPRPRLIAVSARTGDGIDAWVAWLEGRRSEPAAVAS